MLSKIKYAFISFHFLLPFSMHGNVYSECVCVWSELVQLHKSTTTQMKRYIVFRERMSDATTPPQEKFEIFFLHSLRLILSLSNIFFSPFRSHSHRPLFCNHFCIVLSYFVCACMHWVCSPFVDARMPAIPISDFFVCAALVLALHRKTSLHFYVCTLYGLHIIVVVVQWRSFSFSSFLPPPAMSYYLASNSWFRCAAPALWLHADASSTFNNNVIKFIWHSAYLYGARTIRSGPHTTHNSLHFHSLRRSYLHNT